MGTEKIKTNTCHQLQNAKLKDSVGKKKETKQINTYH
jgi:hypothetical protein